MANVIQTAFGPVLLDALDPATQELVKARELRQAVTGVEPPPLETSPAPAPARPSVNIFEDLPTGSPGQVPIPGAGGMQPPTPSMGLARPWGTPTPEPAPTAPPSAGEGELFTGPRRSPGAGPLAGSVQGALTASVETRRPVAPGVGGGYGRELDRGIAEQREGLSIQGAARAQFQADKATETDKLEATLLSEKEASDQRLAVVSERKQEALARIDAAEQKLAAFKFAPDPWANSTTEQKVMGAIGLMLSSVGSTMTRTRDNALTILNDAFERDAEAQRIQYDKLKGEVSSARNLYAFWRQEGFDERDALQASIATAKELTAVRLEGLAARAGAAEQKGILLQHAGALRAQAAEAKHGMAARNAAIDLQRQELALRGAEVAAKLQGATGVDPKLLVPGAQSVDGGAAVARTPKEAQDASNIIGTYRELSAGLERLREIREKAGAGGFEVFDRSLVNAGKNAAASMQLGLKELFKLGVLSETDFEYIRKIVPDDPTGMGFQSAKLDEFQRFLEVKTTQWLSTRGPRGMVLEGSAKPAGFTPLGGGR